MSRLLLECCNQHQGVYSLAEHSAPSLQRSRFARDINARLPGFSDVTYTSWTALLSRLAEDADRRRWRGPFVIDDFPHLATSDPSLVTALEAWIDSPQRKLHLVASGSSRRSMRSIVLDSGAPLVDKANEAFEVKPLRPGFLADVFPFDTHAGLISPYALWGGVPLYWQLARSYGTDHARAVDTLVLDPCGPLHQEADRILREQTPPVAAWRPVLELIGAGMRRVSEIARHLGRPTSSLSGPIAELQELGLLRREIPFGSSPRTGKRSRYEINDPFLRMWFRTVAAGRAELARLPAHERLRAWQARRAGLEADAWRELCRMAVPRLHHENGPLAELGPFEPAQPYWNRTATEFDIVARSIDRRHVLVGKALPTAASVDTHALAWEQDTSALPGIDGIEVVSAVFCPTASDCQQNGTGPRLIGAKAVMAALR